MIRRKIFCARRAAIAAFLALASFAGLAAGHAADLDPAQMSADAIKALEQRLTDAGCYKGAVDGNPSAALDDAIKACPDQRPFLRIETGMHTARINRIGVDAACTLLATASEDKTVRLWSLPDGKLKKVVRLPISEGNAGKVFATALSPDGRWLAAGGYDATWDKLQTTSVTIVDLSNGAIRRFGAFESAIDQIAYSADGRRIAIGLGGNNGVRVLDSATGTELLADRDYGADVYGLAFAPDGALIASSWDGQLRRYGPDLKLTVKRAAPDGKNPHGVAIDPSGRRVAIGYADMTSVSILNTKTLAPLAKGQTRDVNGDLESVAWSRDGAKLVAGGRADIRLVDGRSHELFRRFDAEGRRAGSDPTWSTDQTILDIQACGQDFVFAVADPSFGVLSAQGVVTSLQGPRTADMRNKIGSALAVSPDATSVRFELGQVGAKPVLFDLAAAGLTDSAPLPPGFVTARVDGLPVTDWKNYYEPKFNGAKIALDKYETSEVLAIRPDASGFTLGTDFWVRTYDAKGKERWNHAGPGIAWGADFSADGEIIVVAYGDGTIRWLRWSDGAELLAFFVEPQSRKWVAWTPTGYYMASAGGEDLIGWHVNRGWNQEADFFSASQFRAEYNRPDIVKLVLKTRDEAEAVRQANEATHREAAKPIAAALPPVVAIGSPHEGDAIADDTIRVDFTFRSPSGLGIDRLDVLVDGEAVPTRGFHPLTTSEPTGHVTLFAPQAAKAKISLIAHAGDLTSSPATVDIRLPGQGEDAAAVSEEGCGAVPPAKRPRLFALLVGVTGYENAADLGDLQFPGRDAEGLADALQKQQDCLFGEVHTKIADVPQEGPPRPDRFGPPTRLQVYKGLKWLKDNANTGDLTIVYLDGHGWLDPDQKFWFLTQEADTADLPGTAVPGADILTHLRDVKGKKILLIDACHSGKTLEFTPSKAPTLETRPNMDQVIGDFTQAADGIVAYAAAQAKESAWEYPEFDRHSAFAKALIEAFGEGKGAVNGLLKTNTLYDYVKVRVHDLAQSKGHEQTPVWNKPGLEFADFAVAVAEKP
jgi:Caspase domain/WD domain, G-beta repeat